MIEAEFRTIWLAGESDSWDWERHIDTAPPALNDGEGRFEAFKWIAAVRKPWLGNRFQLWAQAPH